MWKIPWKMWRVYALERGEEDGRRMEEIRETVNFYSWLHSDS